MAGTASAAAPEPRGDTAAGYGAGSTPRQFGALLGRYVPLLSWLPTYERSDLRFDAIAGVVSWGIMVPVAMAYAGLAGMPPETGLVTAFVALALYAVFGTSRHVKVTTSSSIAIMSASVVAALARADPAYYVSLSAALALIVGVILDRRWCGPAGVPVPVPRGVRRDRVRHRPRGDDHRRPDPGTARHPVRWQHDHPEGRFDRREPRCRSIRTRRALGIGCVVGILLIKRFAPRIPGALVALLVGHRALLRARPRGPWGRRRRSGLDRSAGTRHPEHPVRRRRVPDHRRVRDRVSCARRIDRCGACLRHPTRLRDRSEPGAHRAWRGERRRGAVRRLLGGRELQPVRRRRGVRQSDAGLVADHRGAGARDGGRPCAACSPSCRSPSFPRSSSRPSSGSWISPRCAATSPGSGPISCSP